MNTFIKAISYYLPEKILTNEDLAQEFPEWTVEKIASKIGVNQRHIAEKNQTAADLGVNAAEKLFTEHNIDKNSVDFLLFCTQSPDYFLPTSACIMQNKLNLPTTCGALDFNLGCSGYVYGLSLAKGLIVSGIAKNVLLITAETYTKHLHPKDKGNRTIFGDAAAATLISTDGFAEIGNFALGTDGKGAENLIVKTGAFREKNAKNDLTFDENKFPKSSDFLFMDGGEIFNFTAKAVPELVDETLKINNLQQKNIDLFVFHQANKFMINFLRKQLKIDKEKFFVFMENVGNTVSCTIPIALYEAQKQGVLKGNALLVGFGVGYSWGGTVLNSY
ncbi:MAG: ketoacyl-ACP synthase III [Prevotellaceae bacterium]|jgi:3-oxoacyl-[acyl-carrier-protein] synthase-3|nr:ketoacyl-ACP synthase III [Prevotellaceae bacterium]